MMAFKFINFEKEERIIRMVTMTKADEPCEFVADEISDIENLPKEPSYLKAGSKCTVIEDTSVWVLGSDYEWHQVTWYR